MQLMKRTNGRNGIRMSDSSKTLGSEKSDDHMGKKKTLSKDATNGNLEHINLIRRDKGLPELDSTKPDNEESKALEEGMDDLALRDGELIECERIYSRTTGGMTVGRPCTEDEFVASHRKVRRERSTYRELDGRMAVSGKVYSERKGEDFVKGKRKSKTRKGVCPLRTIMVRAMPHEGIAAGERMTKKALSRAVDHAAIAFAKATGAEIVTAAAHRMSGHDLHIHLQYTMVQAFEEPSKTFAARHNKWKKAGVEMACAELIAEGTRKPHNRTIGVRRKKLIEEGKLDLEPVRAMEFRKIPGLRSIGDDAILGYTFRNKVNLVRAAEAGEDPELPGRVAAKRDERGRFRELVKNSGRTLEKKYLDLWFEGVWRSALRDQLPVDAQKEMVDAGVEAARDYVILGTTAVEPTHVEGVKKELKEEADRLLKKQKEMETDTAKQTIAQKVTLELIRKRQKQIDADTKALLDKAAVIQEKERKADILQADLTVQLEALRNLTEPVSVAETAAKMRFLPEKESETGALVREVKFEEKPTIVQKLLLKGQAFVFSVVDSKNKPERGEGAISLILAIIPDAKLEKVARKLLEWFPTKKHAIMAEIIEKYGSPLLKEMVKATPDEGNQAPPGGFA